MFEVEIAPGYCNHVIIIMTVMCRLCTTRSTPQPVMCGALAALCMRYGVLDTYHLRDEATKRYTWKIIPCISTESKDDIGPYYITLPILCAHVTIYNCLLIDCITVKQPRKLCMSIACRCTLNMVLSVGIPCTDCVVFLPDTGPPEQ